MGIPILLFRLEGVLQSWGEHSKWDYRDTADFPSKSGVVGLLGCALGLERDDIRLGEISKSLSMIVRADRIGELITDFHTITAEVLYSASGKPRANGNTVISHRSYIQDASFLVGLTGPKKLLEELSDALLNPKWTIYLGRKSCVPSVPIIGNITENYISLSDAMEKHPVAKRHDEVLLVEMECNNNEGHQRPDERMPKEGLYYQTRRVKTHYIKKEDVDVSE